MMNRRRFLTFLSVSGAVTLSAGYGVISGQQSVRPLTIKAAVATIDSLLVSQLRQGGEWSLAKVFRHCAQSIQFSMRGGYPEHKSEHFKRLLGYNALQVFESIGAMSHALNEAIPGAPPIATDSGSDTEVTQALQALKAMYIAFDDFDGELLPHFAYGQLTKREYEVAHVLHLYNHLDEVLIQS